MDLEALQRRGVRLTGRLRSLAGHAATFGDELASLTSDADRRMHAFLDTVDRYVAHAGLTSEVLPPVRPAPVAAAPAPSRLDLRAEGIRTVVLATGYRPDHDWVDLPVMDAGGAFRHRRGVTDAPGVYVVGQRFQHRRDSGFIDGARHDAQAVVRHLTSGAAPVADDLRRPLTGAIVNDHDYDVAVVGGRVAGASTALLLARAGLRVVVLERSRPGTDTLSTHALMRAGVLQLSRWGVLPQLVAAGTPGVRSVDFHHADGGSAHVSLRPSPGVDALYAPRRHLLDRVLVEAAGTAGADVLHGVPVLGLLRDDDGRVEGVRAAGTGRREVRVRAGLTVGADGIGSLVARDVGARVLGRGRAASAILYRYVAAVPSEGYVWAYGEGTAAGLIPTNADETCVFVATTPERMRPLRREGAEAAFDRLLDTAPGPVAHVVRGGGVAGRVHGWRGVPGHVRHSFGPGWALVGDAGYFRDPITTHGITDALRDAELLADAVLAGCGAGPPGRALAQYQDTRGRLSTALADVTEAVCRYDWDGDRIRTLLRAAGSAMSDEMEHLSARAGSPATAPA